MLALTRIDGTLAGLSSRPGARASVRLSARLNDTAPVTLEGQLDPLGADVFTDLALQSKGIDLKPIGPYAARYLGYEFDRGRLDIDMRYRLEQRILKGATSSRPTRSCSAGQPAARTPRSCPSASGLPCCAIATA